MPVGSGRPTLVLDAGIARRLTGGAGPDLELTAGLTHAFAIRGLMPKATGTPDRAPSSPARVTPRAEQFYYPGSFNWQFLARYPGAARLFNGFDYGHATLYEHLLTTPRARLSQALDREYRYLTTDLLRRPPRFGVAEVAIEPQYARIAWQAKLMFDWAHVLHRQVYDAYADPSLSETRRDSLIETLTDYYLSRSAYAFTAVPKSMALMDGQWFSQRFRTAEGASMASSGHTTGCRSGCTSRSLPSSTPAEQRAGVDATVAHFWAMLDDGGAGASGHADDGRHRAGVLEAAPPGGGDLRQPAHDARHHLRHPHRWTPCRSVRRVASSGSSSRSSATPLASCHDHG